MPNWCSNAIYIKGRPEDIKVIAQRIEEADSFLDGVCPIPGEWDYSKCVELWGTKWADKTENGITVDGTSISFNIETAWAPPIAGLAMAAKQYPLATFGIAYTEPGMAFGGYAVAGNGRLLFDQAVEYPAFDGPDDDEDEDAHEAAYEKFREIELNFESELFDSMEGAVEENLGIKQARKVLGSNLPAWRFL